MDGALCTGALDREGPRCIKGLDCLYQEKLAEGWLPIPARDSMAAVVVLQSCYAGGFLMEPRTDGAHNIAINLLDGWCSAVITPHRMHAPQPMESFMA